jgi:radical SAM protein (TIGR01212 family)
LHPKKNRDRYNSRLSHITPHGEEHPRPGNWYGKPYYFFGDYLRYKYKARVLKLPINAGFSCPNRDGTISHEGCVFCSEDGSASPTAADISDIREQMGNAKKSFKRVDSATRFIAYFQAFTNTYAPPEELKQLYDTALSVDDVIGLMIATRPDCISDEVLSLLKKYQGENFELWLEIGMQSIHDKSLKYLKRGHTHKTTRDSIIRAADSGIPVCVHVILGIPDESWSDMMQTAQEISSLPIKGVKFHHLHVIKGTTLETHYRENKIPIIPFKEYISTICDFIERLRPDILIHRLLGDRDERTLIAPQWGLHKGTVIKAIEDELARRGTFQGFLYN